VPTDDSSDRETPSPDELRERFGIEEVVVAKTAWRNGDPVFHLPDDDDPERPTCLWGERQKRTWRDRPVDLLSDAWFFCRHCDPDYEVKQEWHPNESAQLLIDADPDDFGTPMNDPENPDKTPTAYEEAKERAD
jgi:hypothetical protein